MDAEISAVPAVRRYHVPTSCTRLCVHEWRPQLKGDGASLVFLHATGFHGRCWDQVIAGLGNRHVLAVDIRGHGGSGDARFKDWSELGEDVVDLLRTLDVHSAVGVGHSLGGFLLLYAASRTPAAIARAILFDPVVLPHEVYRNNINPMAVPDGVVHPIARRQSRFASIDDMRARLRRMPPYRSFDPAVLDDYCRFGVVVDANGVGCELACQPAFEASVYQEAANYAGIFDRLDQLDAPVTVIRAKTPQRPEDWHDFSFSPTYPRLAELVPNGRDVHLPDTTHFLPLQDPARASALILAAMQTPSHRQSPAAG